MNEIVLPDPFAPLLQFVQSMNQSLNQFNLEQEKLKQECIKCYQELQDGIEHVLEKDEAIRELTKKSEDMGAEISAVLFVNEEEDLVEAIHVDSIGSLTEVDLGLVKVPPAGSGLTAWSIHTHPRYQNISFSEADVSVAKSRVWERGHCVISEVGGVARASCMEL
jgi:hypothetical protein